MNSPSKLDSAVSPKSTQAYEQASLQLLRIAADPNRSCSDLLTDIASIAARALDVERVGVWTLVDEGKVLRCYHLYQRTGAQVFSGTVLHSADFPIYFAALHSHRAIPAGNARTDPLTHELVDAYLLPLSITSMLDAPIYADGHVVGVVCHEDTGPLHQWNDIDHAFAAATADTISRVLAEKKRVCAEDRAEHYERQLSEIHRMETLGRAAANIAHDFRNVLSIVSGFGGLIQSLPEAGADAHEYAHRIVATADHGRQLTQQLLSFAGGMPVAPRILDLRQAIESMRDMLQILIGNSIRLNVRLAQVPGRVLIDATQLERALINLVVNARDAMPSGGTLTLALDRAEATNDAAAQQVVIRVIDTGIGIDDETRAQIFEPFYTTKGEHGNGLGLTIVKQIVTRAGGHVEVESEPGRGTTMSLYLPCIANRDALTEA